MNYIELGNTGVKVSRLCLGTMTFGEQNTEQEAHEQLDYAVSQGINFIDTAEIYAVPVREETYGATERFIGTWLAKRKNRDKLIIATKIVGPSKDNTYVRGGPDYSPEQLRQAVEGSLKRLQTDYIDLYQLHWPERKTNFFGKLGYVHQDDDTWKNNFRKILETLNSLIKEGKIRFIGLSNETPWGVMQYLKIAETNNLPSMVSIQNPYNLINRTYEIGLAEISHRENISLLAYSPLAGGLLTGKYFTDPKPQNARFVLFSMTDRYENEQASKAAKKYVQLAQEYGIGPAQMALAFVNSRSFLTSNIIGATSMEQLKENIGSINIQLPDEVIKKIENIHTEQPNPAP